jgi:hypothetical protein
MDAIFGSEGTSQADFERIEEINKEIGLDTLVRGIGNGASGGERTPEEKMDVSEGEEKREL